MAAGGETFRRHCRQELQARGPASDAGGGSLVNLPMAAE
jgi:hypothetical protein